MTSHHIRKNEKEKSEMCNNKLGLPMHTPPNSCESQTFERKMSRGVNAIGLSFTRLAVCSTVVYSVCWRCLILTPHLIANAALFTDEIKVVIRNVHLARSSSLCSESYSNGTCCESTWHASMMMMM